MNELYKMIESYLPYDEKEKIDQEVILDFIKNNRNALLRDNKIAHITTSAWITNKERNKVLMIYHNIYKSWAWVGGHADGDSDLLHVIKKEIREETGVTDVKLLSNGIYGLNILTVESHIKKGKIVNSHLHLDIEFYFETSEDAVLRIKEDENSGVKWINIENVLEVITEDKMRPIYERLIKKMK